MNGRGGNYQNSRGFHNQRGYRGNSRGRFVEIILIFHEAFHAEVVVIINMKGGAAEEGEVMTK